MSLATFMRLTASVLSAPLISTMLSCAASASNLLGALTNGRPVSAATCTGGRSKQMRVHKVARRVAAVRAACVTGAGRQPQTWHAWQRASAVAWVARVSCDREWAGELATRESDCDADVQKTPSMAARAGTGQTHLCCHGLVKAGLGVEAGADGSAALRQAVQRRQRAAHALDAILHLQQQQSPGGRQGAHASERASGARCMLLLTCARFALPFMQLTQHSARPVGCTMPLHTLRRRQCKPCRPAQPPAPPPAAHIRQTPAPASVASRPSCVCAQS